MTVQDALAAGQDANASAVPETPAPAAAEAAVTDAFGQPDPALIELEAARRELAAEETGEAGNTDAGSQPPTAGDEPLAPSRANQGHQQPQDRATDRPPVPYARFQKIYRDAQQAIEKAAYLEGANAVLLQQIAGQVPAPQPSEAAALPQQTAAPNDPGQHIRAARAEIRALASRYDNAELSLAELEDARAVQEDLIFQAQQVMLQASIGTQAAQPQVGLADEQILQQQLADLYTQHPYAQSLTIEQARFLEAQVRQEATARGNPLGQGVKDVQAIRAQVAALSDFYGPRWGLQPAAASKAASPAQPRPGNQKGLSPEARARMAKITMAAGLPPDPASFGTAGGAEAVSDASIIGMTDEQIAALPSATRSRILGM